MGSVFISYSRYDTAAADRVAAGLRRAGLQVFLDRDGIRGGGPFASQITRAISRCDVFVLLISPASARSAYVLRELHVAADDYQRPILPVVVADADITPFRLMIAGLQQVDFRHGSDQELADVVDGVYRAAAEHRRHRPGVAIVTVGVLGTILAGLGVMLCVSGMGYFLYQFAEAWNNPRSGPPPGIPLAFGIFFVGAVVGAVGESLRRMRQRRPLR